MPYKFNPITGKLDYFETGTVGDVNLTTSTDTNLTGFIKGDGSKLSADNSTYLTAIPDPLTPSLIEFNTNPTVGAFKEGKMYYNSANKTISVDVDTDVTLQIGQEDLTLVYNGTLSALTNGQVVYINGAFNGVPSVALAKGDAESTSFVLGVVTNASIAPSSYGLVTSRGMVHDVSTGSFSVGDILYLSGSVAGALTKVQPSGGNYDVKVARAIISNTPSGSIFVNVRQPSKLNDLVDVTTSSPTTDQVLRFNGTEWVNGNSVSSSASPGIDFFPDDTSIIATSLENAYPIKTLSKTPIITAEDVDSIVLNTNTVMYGTYLYDTALGRTSIDAGVWSFDVYAGVSSANGVTTLKQNINRVRPGVGTLTTTGTGTTRTAIASSGTPFNTSDINVGGTVDSDSFIRTTTGLFRILSRVSDTEVTIETLSGYNNQNAVAFSVHKRLFQITTPEINNTATSPLFTGLQLYTVNSVQPAYTIQTTDKISNSFFGTSDASTRTVYFSHNGTTRYSHFSTPLITLHNNLAGLNGGSANEMYHLTSAQHTVATQAATGSVNGYLASADFSTFSAKLSDAPSDGSTYGRKNGAWAVAGGGSSGYTTDFDNSDLASGILTVTHNLGTKYHIVAVYNNSDVQVIPDNVTLSSTSALTVDLTTFGTLTGNWNVVVI